MPRAAVVLLAATLLAAVYPVAASAYLGTAPPGGFEPVWRTKLHLNFIAKGDRPGFCLRWPLLFIGSGNDVVAVNLEARTVEKLATLPGQVFAVACTAGGGLVASAEDRVAYLDPGGRVARVYTVEPYAWIEALAETPWGLAAAWRDRVALLDAEGGKVWIVRIHGDVAALQAGRAGVMVATVRPVDGGGSEVAIISPGGSVAWSRRTSSPVTAAAYTGGRVLVGLEDGSLQAYSDASGLLLWRTRLPAPARDIAPAGGSAAYVLLEDGTVLRVDAATGEARVAARGLKPAKLMAAALLPPGEGFVEFLTTLEEWKQGIVLYRVPETGVLEVEAPRGPGLGLAELRVEGPGGSLSLDRPGGAAKLYASPGVYRIQYRYRPPGLSFTDPSMPSPRLAGSIEARVEAGRTTLARLPSPYETHGLLVVHAAPGTEVRVYSPKYFPLGTVIPMEYLGGGEARLLLPEGEYRLVALQGGEKVAEATVSLHAGEVVEVALAPSHRAATTASQTATANTASAETTRAEPTTSATTAAAAAATRKTRTWAGAGSQGAAYRSGTQEPPEISIRIDTEAAIIIAAAVIAAALARNRKPH